MGEAIVGVGQGVDIQVMHASAIPNTVSVGSSVSIAQGHSYSETITQGIGFTLQNNKLDHALSFASNQNIGVGLASEVHKIPGSAGAAIVADLPPTIWPWIIGIVVAAVACISIFLYWTQKQKQQPSQYPYSNSQF